ncbi:MAG: hypothetical protein R2822_11555 [Spirosomataceae bacterium]
MKKYLICTYLLLFSTFYQAIAQTRKSDSLFYQPFETIHLKPIVIGANGRYYYGGQRLRSSYSLEIPFADLNDDQVNRYFKNSRTIRTLGSVVAALPTIYFLIAGRNSGISRQTFWTTYFASIGVSLASNLVANGQMRKAVNTYNLRLARPRVGLSVQETANNRLVVGLSMRVGVGR